MALQQWLPRSQRGGGEWNTPNLTIPTGIDSVYVELDVQPNDFATPDLSVTMTVEVSQDGALSWRHMTSAGWVGGQPSPKTGKWYAQTGDLSLYMGALVRVHFSTSGSFRWGLLGELS